MTDFFRLKPSDPDFYRLFHRNTIDDYRVYTSDRTLIGQVSDTWIDEAGRYYLVVDRSLEREDSKVLVPLGQFQIDYQGHQIHTELPSAQLLGLPIVTTDGIVSGAPQAVAGQIPAGQIPAGQIPAGQTEANQAIGRQTTVNQAANPATNRTAMNSAAADVVAPGTRTFAPLEDSVPIEGSAPLDIPHPSKEVQHVVMPSPRIDSSASIKQPVIEQSTIEQPTLAPAPAAEVLARPVQPISPTRTSAHVTQEAKIRLMEERLIINARRQKVGDVIVRKEIITEMVQVPIRREKLIVEQVSPERKRLVEVDLGEGDRSAVELIDSMHTHSNLTGAPIHSSLSQHRNGTDRQSSSVPIQVASKLLAELANRSEYRGASVRLEFTDPGLQAEYQLRSRQSQTNSY